MKRILLLLLLFVLIPIITEGSGKGIGFKGGGVGVATAAGGDDVCTGGLVYAIHFEQDEDVNTGSPKGCVDNSNFNDVTGTLNSSATVVPASDGYLNVPTTADYVSFDITTVTSQGSILLKVDNITYNSFGEIFAIEENSDNYLKLVTMTQNDLRFEWKGQTSQFQAQLLGGNFTLGSVYFVVMRWDTDSGHSPDGLRIDLFNSSETLLETKIIANDLVVLSPVPGSEDFKIGNPTANASAFKIHYMKIWDTYAAAPTSGFPEK